MESQGRWARRGDNMNLVFRGTHESQAWPGPWQPLTPLCCAVPKKAGAAGSPGVTHAHTHLLADEGAQGDVLQGPHAPAHVLCPVELQPCPGKQGEPLTAKFSDAKLTLGLHTSHGSKQSARYCLPISRVPWSFPRKEAHSTSSGSGGSPWNSVRLPVSLSVTQERSGQAPGSQ